MITADQARKEVSEVMSTRIDNTQKWIKEMLPLIEQRIRVATSSACFDTYCMIQVNSGTSYQNTDDQMAALAQTLSDHGYHVEYKFANATAEYSNYKLTLMWSDKK